MLPSLSMDLNGQTRCTLSYSQAPTASGRYAGPEGCRRTFLKFFPGGFRDEKYIAWERDYKWNAHLKWDEQLGPAVMRSLIKSDKHQELARRAVTIESRTNLLFSFEKMALRDAVKGPAGAKAFSEGLYQFLHGRGSDHARFDRWVQGSDEYD